MSEKQIQKAVLPESPASWNTRYIDPTGFVCQLTLRAECGKELLGKVELAIAYLLDNGCQPFYYSRGNGRQSNNDSQTSDTIQNRSDDNSNNPAWCPIHDVEMKLWRKNGGTWYSHKIDGAWCKGAK